MRRGWLAIALVAAITVPAGVAMQLLRPAETSFIAAGTIEAYNIDVGSKEGGRIAEILVHEGDSVRAGEVLVVFAAAELEARVRQAAAAVELAAANLARMENGSRPEDIAEARAASDADHGFRRAEAAEARAALQRARADLVNAERSYRRARDLRATSAVAQQFLDDAEARLKSTQAEAIRTEHSVAAAEGRLQAASAATARAEHGSRAEDIAAAHAELKRADAELMEAQARLAERMVRAPADATVEVLDLRPGDLVAAGGTVARLLEAGQLYVMVYVPVTQLGRVWLGQNAELRVDAFPDAVFQARVAQIRQQAEFLPRNVQTRDERVHQVIGVKLHVDDPQHRLRAGVSAEARFLEAPRQ